jgi:hypothetical protein
MRDYQIMKKFGEAKKNHEWSKGERVDQMDCGIGEEVGLGENWNWMEEWEWENWKKLKGGRTIGVEL